MRSGAAAVQNTLTLPAQQVLTRAINNAHGRGHAQVQPLHVAFVLLAHEDPLLRQACADTHSQASHGLQQCRALELCFNVALERLPQSSSSSTVHPLGLSNALVAALKRAQTHQKRGCPDQQQPPLLTVKVEIEQLIISILEDPSVSRVMKEAGFQSQKVKTNLENAIGLSASLQQGSANLPSYKPSAPDNHPLPLLMNSANGLYGNQQFATLEKPSFVLKEDINLRSLKVNAHDQESRLSLPLVGCMGTTASMSPLEWDTLEATADKSYVCCSECMAHYNAECKQIQAQDSGQAPICQSPSSEGEGTVTPLPSWLRRAKDMKSELEMPQLHSQQLYRKWLLTCMTSHPERQVNSVSSPGRDGGPSLLHHSWINASIPNNAENSGLVIPKSTPLQSKDMTPPPTQKPNLSSPLPHWARGLSSAAVPDCSLTSNAGTADSKLFRVETAEKQVESYQANGKISRQEGQGLPEDVGPVSSPSPLSKLNASLSITSPSPLSKLSASLLIGKSNPAPSPSPLSKIGSSIPSTNPSPLSKLKASLPKSSASSCPLKGNVLSRPSPLSVLKTSKPSSNSPLKGNFTLVRPQNLSPKPSLNQPVDILAKDDQPSLFDHKAAERLKHVYKGLLDRVAWQGRAVSTIATSIVNAQTGRGALRGNISRADTWLLLLGPDQVGKRLVVDALAELVLGVGAKPICFGDLGFSRWGRKVEETDGLQLRGRTAEDSVADAIRANPLSILFLEDIDQADFVLRSKLTKAMETGKFSDSNDRHISVGNSIIIMTSRLGADCNSGIGKENTFSEARVSSLNGARMSLLLRPPREQEVVFQGDSDISVVRDTISASLLEKPANLLFEGQLLKRKPSGFLSRALKKCSTPTGRSVALDLNLSAEENEAVLTEAVASFKENATKACTLDPILRAVQEVLSPKFVSLVDCAVVFERFDLMGQANWLLSQLSSACFGLIPKVCSRIEVDFQLLEHMVSIIWRTPNGRLAFENWVEKKTQIFLKCFYVPLRCDRK